MSWRRLLAEPEGVSKAVGLADRTASMSATDKVGKSMRRSLPLVPRDAARLVEQMLQPRSLAIITGTLVVWAGSHFFGVGEVVDIVLLIVGVFALGFSAFSGSRELYEFATTAIGAKTDAELDERGT